MIGRFSESEKLPLFGRVNHIKDEIFGTEVVVLGNIHLQADVVFAKSKAEIEIYHDTPVHIFSNGSEYDGWYYSNCANCSKRDCCALEHRIAMAYFDTGKIPYKTVKRIGYKSLHVQKEGLFAHLSDCKEVVCS